MKRYAFYETSLHYLIHTNPLLLHALSQNNLVFHCISSCYYLKFK